MRMKFRITYDLDKEAAFLVYTPSKIIEFLKSTEGIYTLDMEQNNNEYENKMIINRKKTNISNVITIENNKTEASDKTGRNSTKFIICVRITYLYRI